MEGAWPIRGQLSKGGAVWYWKSTNQRPADEWLKKKKRKEKKNAIASGPPQYLRVTQKFGFWLIGIKASMKKTGDNEIQNLDIFPYIYTNLH